MTPRKGGYLEASMRVIDNGGRYTVINPVDEDFGGGTRQHVPLGSLHELGLLDCGGGRLVRGLLV